jgi:hypothetical protein
VNLFQIRQHKWQKLKLAFVPRLWRELNRGLWVNPSKCLASAAAVAAFSPVPCRRL